MLKIKDSSVYVNIQTFFVSLNFARIFVVVVVESLYTFEVTKSLNSFDHFFLLVSKYTVSKSPKAVLGRASCLWPTN